MNGPPEEPGRTQTNAPIERARRREGGKAGSSVNSQTSQPLCTPAANAKPNSKAAEAAELGVTVLTPQAFAELLADHLNQPAGRPAATPRPASGSA
ncbi:hypothetical protein OHA32_40450 [Streptomyces erythrochromogenes]|nr:hypothetical protein [Streptomyces erythrochromogenes]